MKRLSCIVTKSEIQTHLGDVELETSITHAYAIDIHEPITIIVDQMGKGMLASWGLNPLAEKRTIHLPHVNFLRVHVKPTFRMAFRQSRAVAVLDSFYCWHKDQGIPFRVRMEQTEPMFVPCIYQSMDTQSYTCTLLVRDARETLSYCTEVEPLVFTREETKKWLDQKSVSQAMELLTKNKSANFTKHQVSNKVMIKGYSDKSLHQDKNREATLFG